MKNTHMLAAAAAILITIPLALSGLMRANAQIPSPGSGDYFGCQNGWRLEVYPTTNPRLARCVRNNQSEFDPGNCAPGFAKRLDHRGNVDACVAGPIAGDLVCLDPATRMVVRKGKDVCQFKTAYNIDNITIRQTAQGR
jgi:hypothetical protein